MPITEISEQNMSKSDIPIMKMVLPVIKWQSIKKVLSISENTAIFGY